MKLLKKETFMLKKLKIYPIMPLWFDLTHLDEFTPAQAIKELSK